MAFLHCIGPNNKRLVVKVTSASFADFIPIGSRIEKSYSQKAIGQIFKAKELIFGK